MLPHLTDHSTCLLVTFIRFELSEVFALVTRRHSLVRQKFFLPPFAISVSQSSLTRDAPVFLNKIYAPRTASKISSSLQTIEIASLLVGLAFFSLLALPKAA